MSARSADVVVVGGGVIGLAIAWRTACAGMSVVVCDPEPGRGASWAAAGMLAPVTEVHYGENALLALNLESARRWPAFAAELEAASGVDVDLCTDGTLLVAADDDDLRFLDELLKFQLDLGLDVARLRSRECRDIEPMVHPRVRGGLFAAGDHRVDNRRVVAALLRAADHAGVTVVREPVATTCVQHARASGVRLANGDLIGAGTVVLAAGAWSVPLTPPEVSVPVRPVKGQILRLHVRDEVARPACAVRGVAGGRSVYVVPRSGGEIVVGATVEELGFDTSNTAGAVHELLHVAIDVVPGLSELPLVETFAGLRPGTPDNAPVLGATSIDGLLVATGHYRNGILLTPVTADAITSLIVGGDLPAIAAPFTMARFAA